MDVKVERVFKVGNLPAVRVGPILEIKPEGNALLKQLKENASKLIKSQGNCDAMNVGIGKLKKLTRFIEKCRLEATKPLRNATSEINERVAAVTEPFKDVISRSAAQVWLWDKEQDRLQKIAEEKAAEEERKREEARLAEEERRRNISKAKGGKGEITPVPVPEPVTRPTPLTVARSTQYRKNWIALVTSFAAVPDEFKTLNTVKINEAKNRSKDKDGVPQAKIPGIEWKCDQIRVN